MSNNTEELSNNISNLKTLEELKHIQAKLELAQVPTALEYLLKTVEENGFPKKTFIREIINQSSLERAFVYHLLNGEKNLTRDKLIMFAIVGKLNLEQLNKLLKYAGMATIYVKNRRDLVIQYIFDKHLSLYDANVCLLELDLDTLK